MVEGERADATVRRKRPRTAQLVFAGALGLTLVAWFVMDRLDRYVARTSDVLFPLSLLILLLSIVTLVVLANRGAPRAIWGRSWVSAAAGFAVGLVLAILLAFATYEGCGLLSPESASWSGGTMLHEQLRGGGDHHGNPVRVTAPAPGFAFRDADLDSRWSGYSLVQVAWGRGTGYDFGPVALVAEPGMARAAYLDLADLQGHRQEVVEFLQGLGATPGEAARIAQAMETNATTGAEAAQRWPYGESFVEYHAAIPVAWSPKAAWDSFCCIGQQPADDASHGSFLGSADLRVGHWSFLFALETTHMDGDGFTIDADAEGRVEFVGLAEPGMDEDDYKGTVKRTLKELGLPEPERGAMGVEGSIC